VVRRVGPPGEPEDPLAADAEQLVIPAGGELGDLLAGQLRELGGHEPRDDLLVEMPLR
jgi:hypothetical protein